MPAARCRRSCMTFVDRRHGRGARRGRCPATCPRSGPILLPSLMPLVLRTFALGDRLHLAMGACMVVYGAGDVVRRPHQPPLDASRPSACASRTKPCWTGCRRPSRRLEETNRTPGAAGGRADRRAGAPGRGAARTPSAWRASAGWPAASPTTSTTCSRWCWPTSAACCAAAASDAPDAHGGRGGAGRRRARRQPGPPAARLQPPAEAGPAGARPEQAGGGHGTAAAPPDWRDHRAEGDAGARAAPW